MEEPRELLKSALNGDKRALGRLLTILESSPKKAGEVITYTLDKEPDAHVIGVTGIPGSGKSTLISKLITQYREDNHKIAVIAIDPTSPLSRGALLGDRIRMQEHATDPNVFIRSVPTRGVKGGLSFSGVAMIEVFDYVGYDKVIVESIGVGQTDIDIMNIAHTILVVTTPGLGDDIQALKAGIMEIGDIYVLNKSDKEGAEKTYSYLEFALESDELGVRRGWTPKLIKTSALFGWGIDQLVNLIEEHYKYILESGLYSEKIGRRRMLMLKLLSEKIFISQLEEYFNKGVDRDILRKYDLYDASIHSIKEITEKLTKYSG